MTYAIILAAGKGTRLAGLYDSPKPLLPLSGKPVIKYVLGNLISLNITPVIVVKYKKEEIMEELGSSYIYREQGGMDGTGMALYYGLKDLKIEANDSIIVLNSDDSAFLKKETINSFIEEHERNESSLTVMTVNKENPFGLGRIIKDGDQLISIIEEKEANEEEKKIKEVNTGLFCFNYKFLKDNLENIIPSSVTGEYYVTDLLRIAIQGDYKTGSFLLENDSEIFGFNTPEQYEEAKDRMNKY